MHKEHKPDILNLNKQAMENLRKGEVSQALSLLKQAEKCLISGVHSGETSKFWAITLNNLGCYYKRVNKPVVALHYLKKALDIEKRASTDPLNLAGTYLNICAIRSQLNSHEKALASAANAIKILSTHPSRNSNVLTTLVIAHQNVGLEYSFMNQRAEAAKYFYLGWNLAKEHLGPSHSLSRTLRSSYLSASEKPSMPRQSHFKSARNLSTPSSKHSDYLPSIRRPRQNLSEKRRIVRDNSSIRSSNSSRKHDKDSRSSKNIEKASRNSQQYEKNSMDSQKHYFRRQRESRSTSNAPMTQIDRQRSFMARTKNRDYTDRQGTSRFNRIGKISKLASKSRQGLENRSFRKNTTPRKLMVKPINLPSQPMFFTQDSSQALSEDSAIESTSKGVQVVIHENISEVKDRAATNIQKLWRGFATRKKEKLEAINDKIHQAEIKAQHAIGELQKLRQKKDTFSSYRKNTKQTLVPVPKKSKFDDRNSLDMILQL